MNHAVTLAAIVEGHGEVQAVPVLLRRIGREFYGVELRCLKPHRVPRGKMTKPDELARALRLQAARSEPRGAVVVLLDADDDDPIELTAQLQAVADDTGTPACVVVAVREFEAWFLAGIESLRVHKSMRDDAEYASDPEARRDCKRALQDLMVEPYGEIRHQVAFAAILDLQATATRSESFQRLIATVGALVERAGDAAEPG